MLSHEGVSALYYPIFIIESSLSAVCYCKTRSSPGRFCTVLTLYSDLCSSRITLFLQFHCAMTAIFPPTPFLRNSIVLPHLYFLQPFLFRNYVSISSVDLHLTVYSRNLSFLLCLYVLIVFFSSVLALHRCFLVLY